MATHIAVDFGAGSGRVIAGSASEGGLEIEEIHRFANRQIKLGDRIYWDFPALFEEMKNGLKMAAGRFDDIKSIGIDTWGVDFGLVDRNGRLIGNPICYRDPCTDRAVEEWGQKHSLADMYATSGIQAMPINSIFQLYVRTKDGDPALKMAEHLLFMPDLFSFFLTRIPGNEYTIASTSGLLDARKKDWNWPLIDCLGLPRRIFGRIVMPGTVRGLLKPDIADELGLPHDVKVAAVGSHDTASAVLAVPYEKGKETSSAFLSSGTWSLLGIETDEPILSEDARKAGFSNEGGVRGTIRFLQNITGLWMLQRLISQWKSAGLETGYGYLLSEASLSDINSIVDVDDASFMHPEDMCAAVAQYCRHSGQKMPSSQGEFVKCVLHSLAVRYKKGLKQIESLTGRKIERLHIIGGGSKNTLLNVLTEKETGIPVIAGPAEATAEGNIIAQTMACSEI